MRKAYRDRAPIVHAGIAGEGDSTNLERDNTEHFTLWGYHTHFDTRNFPWHWYVWSDAWSTWVTIH